MTGLVKSILSPVSSLVSGLFGGDQAPPPMPAPPEPVPAPTIEDAAVKARENEDASRRRKGRAAAILTGSEGAGTPKAATKTLLGG